MDPRRGIARGGQENWVLSVSREDVQREQGSTKLTKLIPVKEILHDVKHNVGEIKKFQAKLDSYNKQLSNPKISSIAGIKLSEKRSEVSLQLDELIKENLHNYQKIIQGNFIFTPHEIKDAEKAKKEIARGEKMVLESISKRLKSLERGPIARFFGMARFTDKDKARLNSLRDELNILKRQYFEAPGTETKAQIEKLESKLAKAALIADNNPYQKLLKKRTFTEKDLPQLQKLAKEFYQWRGEMNRQEASPKLIAKIESKLGQALLAAEGWRSHQVAAAQALTDAENRQYSQPREVAILKLKYIQQKYPDPVRNSEIDLVLDNLKRDRVEFENN